MEYTTLTSMAGLLLEESWVLSVTAQVSEVCFELEFVLLPGHASYRDSLPGEQYCYRKGQLILEGVESLAWSDMGVRPAVDASGETDWGHIDTFDVKSDAWELTGDWGRMRLTGSRLDARPVLWAEGDAS